MLHFTALGRGRPERAMGRRFSDFDAPRKFGVAVLMPECLPRDQTNMKVELFYAPKKARRSIKATEEAMCKKHEKTHGF